MVKLLPLALGASAIHVRGHVQKKKRKLTSTFVDIALIKNNARVGSSIAAELCKIRKLKETNAVVSLKSVDC